MSAGLVSTGSVSTERISAGLVDRGKRYDRFLVNRLPDLSRSRIQALIDAGHITVAGRAIRASGRVEGSEIVVVSIPAPQPVHLEAQDLPLSILYEDRHLLAIDKAPGMVVHPAAGHRSGTLVNAVLHHVQDLRGVGGELRPGIVHRLDKDTSGVMVVAKSQEALTALQRAFASREVEKTYFALVVGHPPEAGTYRTLHGRHPRDRKRFTTHVKQGKPAVTHFRVKERLLDVSWMEVALETGRTHQIRVHFAEAGFPLLGDEVYGTRSSRKIKTDRLALHAHCLAFQHPISRKQVVITAELPRDFMLTIERLRRTPAQAPRRGRSTVQR